MLLNKFSHAIERAIGAHKLDHLQRRELLEKQIESVGILSPNMYAAAMIIVAGLLSFSWQLENFHVLAAWAAVFSAITTFFNLLWATNWKKRFGGRVTSKSLRNTSLLAAVLGLSWGSLAIAVLPLGDAEMRTLAVIALTGVLCGASIAMAGLPQSFFAFSAALLVMLITSMILDPNLAHALPIGFMFLAFVAALPMLTIRFASNLVRQVVSSIEMRDQNEFIGLLLDEYEQNGSDWLWAIDKNGDLVTASDRLMRVFGSAGSEEASDEHSSADHNFLEFLTSKAKETEQLESLLKCVSERQPFREVELLLNLDGQANWWRISGKPKRDLNGHYQGFLGIGSDITKAKEAEGKASLLARCDALTGLLNRASFNEDMTRAIAKLERYGRGFALMFIDLDRFKLINDTRGHLVGDELLKQVAERITDVSRQTDGIARLGGDEFAVIMHEDCDAGAAARLAARLISELSKPFEIDGEFHRIGASVGIALAPLNGTRSAQLLRNADLALYRSKADGRGVFRFFEAQMDADEREKRLLEVEMREAIDKDEFELLYQPLISTETGRPTAMEALIRWHHPLRGSVSPVEFIPVAEQSTMIQEIGAWSIRKACQAATQWPDDVVVAVNLSARHFSGSDIVKDTKAALEATGLPARRLELEVTESLLINNTEEVLNTLKMLKQLGVSIALDDFGTGYSSLSYILKFPFDKIKIDRSFVKASGDDEAARSILRMISTLGQSLNIRITAEGVETEEQVKFLRSIDCDQFQGFLFAKPLKEDLLPAFFADETPLLTKLPKRVAGVTRKVA